jgi:hypothetical protein
VKPLVVVHSASRDDCESAPVWRESSLWTSLELRSADQVKLSAATPHGTYKVALQEHLEAVCDEEMLLASVLIHSYALAETAAAERLNGDARDFGGIEDWGTRLLATTGSTWGGVKQGVAGAVEVAVVRNAYAHGGRRTGGPRQTASWLSV